MGAHPSVAFFATLEPGLSEADGMEILTFGPRSKSRSKSAKLSGRD